MRITSKGQVTIPIDIRKRLGLLPSSEVEFEIAGDSVRLRKARGSQRRGQRLLEAMQKAPKPRMPTDRIMALTRGE